MALDSGLVDEKEVDKAEELGEVIQRELDDHGFGEVSFKRKKQIKSLQSLYSEILKKYVKFLSKLKIDIVIFDGYSVSTKDATHSKREKSSNAIEIQDQNRCPADRKSFLSNYTNKQAFIDWLSTHLADAGFEIVKCPADADTTIVKAAINQKGSVNVYSDDTDILCLLLHHFDQSLKRDIILCEMTKAQHQARECVSIKQVIKKIGSAKLNIFFSRMLSQVVIQPQPSTSSERCQSLIN